MSIVYNTSIVRSGLVLHLDAANVKSYPGSGTTWSDLSGKGNHGTLMNGVGYSSTNSGSMVFDGVDDYVVGNITTFTNPAPYTSITWALSTNITPEQHLTNLKGSTQFYIKSGTLGTASYGAIAGGTVIANTWYMFTQTRDSSGNGVIYINDNSVGTGVLPSYGTATQYVIGNYVGGGNYFLNGKISASLVYNRVLTVQEIQQNFNALRGRYGI